MLFNVKYSHYLNKNNAINMLTLRTLEVNNVMNMVLFDIVDSWWTLELESYINKIMLNKFKSDVKVKVDAIKYRVDIS